MKQPIDDIVKDALGDLHVRYNPGGWEALEQRMDAEAADGEFDESIKSELGQMSAAYRHKHWMQLKQWMDYRWYTLNKIYISKSAEAILMLLALFTFFNYNASIEDSTYNPSSIIASYDDSDKSQQPKAYENMQLKREIESVMANQGQSNVTIPIIHDALQSITASDEIQMASKSAKAYVIDETKRESEMTHLTKTKSTRSSNQASRAEVLLNNVPKSKSQVETNRLQNKANNELNQIFDPTGRSNAKIKANRDGLMKHTSQQTGTISNSDISTATTNIESDLLQRSRVKNALIAPISSSHLNALDNLPVLPISLLAFDQDRDVDNMLASNDVEISMPKEKKWAISSFIDLDFNQITTPFDNLYNKTGYNQNRVGAGGGLMVHREVGKVELGMGMNYSSKQYSPKEFIELVKNTPDSEGTAYRFEGIRLNLLSIPVHATYYVTKKGKWRPYITGGAALHLALQAEYKKESERVPSAIPIPQFLEDNEGATVTFGQPNFEKKKFPDGLLGSGSFGDNHYFTIDVGVGIERRLTPSTSFFVQPTVYYNLFNKGLSANNDKINTFSLQLGTKTRI